MIAPFTMYNANNEFQALRLWLRWTKIYKLLAIKQM